jgi:DNA-binding IclR family transcriptional regulator
MKPRSSDREETSNKGIQSIEIGARLLDVLIESRQPMRLKELAERAGMSPSKARMYLVSLIRTGLIEQGETTGLYAPGPKAMRLGIVALGQNDVFGAARALVVDLGKELGQPVILSGWDDESPVVLVVSGSPEALPIVFRTGVRPPLYTTATGAVFLAFMPPVIADPLLAQCPTGDRAWLDKLIEEARKHGTIYRDVMTLGPDVTLGGYGVINAPIFSGTSIEYVLTVLAPTKGSKRRPTELIGKIEERIRGLH